MWLCIGVAAHASRAAFPRWYRKSVCARVHILQSRQANDGIYTGESQHPNEDEEGYHHEEANSH
jgi:hypothetical protein